MHRDLEHERQAYHKSDDYIFSAVKTAAEDHLDLIDPVDTLGRALHHTLHEEELLYLFHLVTTMALYRRRASSIALLHGLERFADWLDCREAPIKYAYSDRAVVAEALEAYIGPKDLKVLLKAL
jgi:hypothetical protein